MFFIIIGSRFYILDIFHLSFKGTQEREATERRNMENLSTLLAVVEQSNNGGVFIAISWGQQS